MFQDNDGRWLMFLDEGPIRKEDRDYLMAVIVLPLCLVFVGIMVFIILLCTGYWEDCTYFVTIDRDTLNEECIEAEDPQQSEYFKHNGNRIWGIVKASCAIRASWLLRKYAYGNGLMVNVRGE